MNKISLILTTYNRGTLLNQSLQRLCNLTLPDEVLVVDDGSIDNTEVIVKEFEGKLPIRYIYNHNPEWSICSMARNIAVKNCIGDVIITSEPEILFVTDIVKQMAEDHKQFPDQVISAGVIYHQQQHCEFHPGLITDPVAALKDSVVEDYQTEPRSYNQSGYCKTQNMQATFIALYRKEWIEMVGGWDEEFPGAWGFDDIDLCTRLRIKGINQHVCPEMEAVHQWHPHLPPHIQGPMMFMNEKHMQDKKLGDENPDNPNLIANVGKPWGVIKSR